MSRAPWIIAIAIPLTLTACVTPPGGSDLGAERHVLQVGAALTPTAWYASSTLEWQGTTYGAFRATDRNADLEWASADTDPAPYLVMDYGRPVPFTGVLIKTGPLRGTTYLIQISNDRINWFPPAPAARTNTSWNLEWKSFIDVGRYLRIRFNYAVPRVMRHVSIFELEARGYTTTGPVTTPLTPPPPAALPPVATPPSLTYLNDGPDRVSPIAAQPDGGRDGHFLLKFDLPARLTLTKVKLEHLNSAGIPSGWTWSSTSERFWLLGTESQASPGRVTDFVTTLGEFAPAQAVINLYAADPSNLFKDNAFVSRGEKFRATVTRADGSTFTAQYP